MDSAPHPSLPLAGFFLQSLLLELVLWPTGTALRYPAWGLPLQPWHGVGHTGIRLMPSHGGEMNHTMLANLWVLDNISCFPLELITPSHGESQRAVTKVLSSGLQLCYWLTGFPCCSTLPFLLPCVTLHRNRQAFKTWFHCQICFGENLSKDENL